MRDSARPEETSAPNLEPPTMGPKQLDTPASETGGLGPKGWGGANSTSTEISLIPTGANMQQQGRGKERLKSEGTLVPRWRPQWRAVPTCLPAKTVTTDAHIRDEEGGYHDEWV